MRAESKANSTLFKKLRNCPTQANSGLEWATRLQPDKTPLSYFAATVGLASAVLANCFATAFFSR